MARTLVYRLDVATWSGGLIDVAKHIDRIKPIGIQYVSLGPIFESSRCDCGYDVEDYFSIDPRFGTMVDFDNFVAKAHSRGVKVLMDLVLGYTSIKHPWFSKHPEYYCWRNSSWGGWKNLYDGGPAWKPSRTDRGYYLSLHHEKEADLKWIKDHNVNRDLVREFRRIVRFWLKDHKVDGFYLNFPQIINKDFTKNTLDLSDLVHGEELAAYVINAVFGGNFAPTTYRGDEPFLIMECYDENYGNIANYYFVMTPVDFCTNINVRNAIDDGREAFDRALTKAIRNSHHFMLDLESHGSQRFTTRANLSATEVAEIMFTSNADAIMIYQGQELGLTGSTSGPLPLDRYERQNQCYQLFCLVGKDS